MIEHWYIQNIKILTQIFGKVKFDETSFLWVIIPSFFLPEIYDQETTRLLIETPGMQINNPEGFNFYADEGLSRSDMYSYEHIYEDCDYNHYRDIGLARLSLHLNTFQAALDVHSGDTLLDVTQNVYNFLAIRKGL